MFGELVFFEGSIVCVWLWLGLFDGTRKSIKVGRELTRGDIKRLCKNTWRFTNGDASELSVCIAPSDLQFALSRFKSSGISPRVISAV